MYKKSKCSEKNSVPFNISLKSWKHKDNVANLKVQKRLDSFLRNISNLGQSQQEGGSIGAILATTAPLRLPLAVKRLKRHFIKMVK